MTKTHAEQAPRPDDQEIELDDIPEFDFSRAARGNFTEWYERAKGHFYEVSDEEDARRTPAERAPGPLLKKALRRVPR